jgi:hypothetical protein
MNTYQLSTHIYLDSIAECYKKIIIINQMPKGPLQSYIRTIQNKKLSPFQSNSNCCPEPACLFAILNPKTGGLLCMNEIATLFSFIILKGYTIQYNLTKIMLKSTEKINKLICYISI